MLSSGRTAPPCLPPDFPLLSARGVTFPGEAVLHQWRPEPHVTGVLSNGEVLELASFRRDSGASWAVFAKWLSHLYGSDWPEGAKSASTGAFSKAVGRLSSEVQRLKKTKSLSSHESLQSLLKSEFMCPGGTANKLNLNAKRVQSNSSSIQGDSSTAEVEQLKLLVKDLTSSLNVATQAKKGLEERLRKSHQKIKNIGRKLKRREETIESKQDVEEMLEGSVTELEEVISALEERSSNLEKSNEVLRKKLYRADSTICYYRLRVRELSTKLVQDPSDHTDEGNSTEFSLHNVVEDLKTKLDEANDLLYENTVQSSQPTEIVTFEDGKYTDAVRQCCLSLLSHNVGIERVSPIVRTVINTLTEHSIGRLPSVSLLSQMLVEAKTVALMQAGEVACIHEDSTLHTDGTTKFGNKYGGFQLSTSTCSLSLGLTDMMSGSAQHTFDSLKQIVHDIELACKKGLGLDNVVAKVVASMRNTMSDRHAVEKNFNGLVEKYRSELLPVAVENWATLSQQEQKSLTAMNHFFCGLHYLVGLAEQAEATLHAWEKLVFGESKVGSRALPGSWDRSESGTVRLVRTVCKAFQKHGSEQAGCPVQFAAFLQSAGFDSVPLATFKGNRFNILFYNAAGIHFLREPIANFLTNVHGTPNRLLQAVLADLAVPEFQAGCRALGLVDKLITGPLWRLLRSKDCTIMDMNKHFSSLCSSFQEWSEDASPLLDGTARPFSTAQVGVSSVLDELLQPSDLDGRTREVLQLLCQAFYTFSCRLLADHLEGGVHANPSAEKLEQTKSVPKSNVISERDFAQLDRLLREKPNVATVALEGIVLFSNNATREWLEQKSPEERAKIFEAARQLAPCYRSAFKQRREKIWEYQRQVQADKQRKLQEKRQRIQQEKEELSEKIGMLGFWSTAETVEAGLAKCKNISGKKDALKTQIRFRRLVLEQTHANKQLFQWSTQGKQFSWVELKANLLQLISESAIAQPSLRSSTQLTPPKTPHDLAQSHTVSTASNAPQMPSAGPSSQLVSSRSSSSLPVPVSTPSSSVTPTIHQPSSTASLQPLSVASHAHQPAQLSQTPVAQTRRRDDEDGAPPPLRHGDGSNMLWLLQYSLPEPHWW